jgi:hypothetical protein
MLPIHHAITWSGSASEKHSTQIHEHAARNDAVLLPLGFGTLFTLPPSHHTTTHRRNSSSSITPLLPVPNKFPKQCLSPPTPDTSTSTMTNSTPPSKSKTAAGTRHLSTSTHSSATTTVSKTTQKMPPTRTQHQHTCSDPRQANSASPAKTS